MTHEKPRAPFVEPTEPSPASTVSTAVRTLVGNGCSEADALWLAPMLLQLLPSNPDDADETLAGEGSFAAVASAWVLTQISYLQLSPEDEKPPEASPAVCRDSALLATLCTLMGELYAPRIDVPQPAPGGDTWAWSIPEDEAVRVACEMCAHGADLRALLMRGWPPMLVRELLGSPVDPAREREKRVCRVLVLAGAIEQDLADELTAPYPEQFLEACAQAACPREEDDSSRPAVDEGSVRSASESVFAHSFGYYLSCFRDPEAQQLARRIVRGSPADVRSLVDVVARASDDRFVILVSTIADAVSARWANSEYGRRFDIFVGHAPMWRDQLRALARDMRPYFELADQRVGAQPSAAAPELRTLWMLLFRMAWDAESEGCPSQLRTRMLAAANEDIAKLRPLLRAADSVGETAEAREFASQFEHFRRCCSLLAFHGGVWSMIKPMVLSLRALGTPALARDLRDWPEFADDPPPEPWRLIPELLTELFHAAVGREQDRDPDLDALREHFGAFCLGRLTDRLKQREREEAASAGRPRTNEEMTESSPEWRYAYVRAVTALRVNPGGKGHRTLHVTAQMDPDEHVREAAQHAEHQLRHFRKLPERVSPRRAVMTALWWLKQAHMRKFGTDVPVDGAQRTRQKELTRTKKREREPYTAAGTYD